MFKERDYQNLILSYLLTKNGYIRGNNADFDREYGIDRSMLKLFLENTQSKQLEKLQKGDKAFNYVLDSIQESIDNNGLLATIKDGVYVDNERFRLVFLKESNGDKQLEQLYDGNVLSVTEEVVYDNEGRVDIVIFLNGLPIATFELKCENSNQDYHDAINQYKRDRSNQKNLFRFNRGSLVHFAMDTNEVYMSTHIKGRDTFFLPFNQGCNGGGGNPQGMSGKLATSYMWEDVLTKETLIRIVAKMVTIEHKASGDVLIFPRYHQLDCIRKIEADIINHKECENYLIQHSTGSGKTNTIAWLADLLASMYYNQTDIRYDKILIITDRVVIDKQLQNAVMSLVGMGKVKTVSRSEELKSYLVDTTRIVVCTIQKLSYLKELFLNLKKSKFKRFAIIIDEAHQSTSGKLMENAKGLVEILSESYVESHIKMTKSEKKDKVIGSIQDDILRRQVGTGKSENVSIFAFTATPKDITLNAFGTKDLDGHRRPFHVYSMTQAIEEGYIIDVLDNYKCYKRYFKTEVVGDVENKELIVGKVKRKVFEHINTSDENIKMKLGIILDEFFAITDKKIDGKAKAMVVTGSILEAVKYKTLIDGLLKERLKSLGRDEEEFKALVAFSKKDVGEGETAQHYTEDMFNQLGQMSIENAFDTDNYRILIVANKFQTGFNQPLLHTMFVDRTLGGVSAVQTLSRLNRTHKGKYDTYVVDFVNDFKDIKAAFKYFAGHVKLQDEITLDGLVTMYQKVLKLGIFTEEDIKTYIQYEREGKKVETTLLLDKITQPLKACSMNRLQFICKTLRVYGKWYEFVSVSIKISDIKYIQADKFIELVLRRLQGLLKEKSEDIDISEYLKHSDIRIREVESDEGSVEGTKGGNETTGENSEENGVNIGLSTHISMPTDRYKLLSVIIEDINLLTQYNLTDEEVDLLVDGIELVQSEEFKKRMETNIKNNPTSEIEETFNHNLKSKFSAHALKNNKYNKGKRLFNGQLGADVSKVLYNAYMKLRDKVVKS